MGAVEDNCSTGQNSLHRLATMATLRDSGERAIVAMAAEAVEHLVVATAAEAVEALVVATAGCGRNRDRASADRSS
jgi:hypothetical protein